MNENKWISVVDRLPEVGQYCLIITPGENQFTAWREELDGYNFRLALNGETIKATHWQPLPFPPPKPDAFEKWWNRWSIWHTNGALHFQDSIIHKNAAAMIWEAAIASTKSS